VEVEIRSKVGNEIEFEVFPLADFIGIKGYKAKGKRLSNRDVRKIKFIDPLPYTPHDSEEKVTDADEPVKQEEENDKSEPEKEQRDAGKETSKEEVKKYSEKKPPKSEGDPPQMELEF
jgi:topoisomerase-4 subunit A